MSALGQLSWKEEDMERGGLIFLCVDAGTVRLEGDDVSCCAPVESTEWGRRVAMCVGTLRLNGAAVSRCVSVHYD